MRKQRGWQVAGALFVIGAVVRTPGVWAASIDLDPKVLDEVKQMINQMPDSSPEKGLMTKEADVLEKDLKDDGKVGDPELSRELETVAREADAPEVSKEAADTHEPDGQANDGQKNDGQVNESKADGGQEVKEVEKEVEHEAASAGDRGDREVAAERASDAGDRGDREVAAERASDAGDRASDRASDASAAKSDETADTGTQTTTDTTTTDTTTTDQTTPTDTTPTP